MLKPRAGTLVNQCTRGKACRSTSRPRTDIPIVTLRRNPRGEVTVRMPPWIAKALGARPGKRVWFAIGSDKLVISPWPWGPYPAGRRSSNKLRGIASRRVGCRVHARSRRLRSLKTRRHQPRPDVGKS